MTVEQVAEHLSKDLRSRYSNIQAVGIRGNNTEAYDLMPHRFAERIEEDSLVVYTTSKPSPDQLALVECDGYKVAWVHSGRFILASDE